MAYRITSSLYSCSVTSNGFESKSFFNEVTRSTRSWILLPTGSTSCISVHQTGTLSSRSNTYFVTRINGGQQGYERTESLCDIDGDVPDIIIPRGSLNNWARGQARHDRRGLQEVFPSDARQRRHAPVDPGLLVPSRWECREGSACD